MFACGYGLSMQTIPAESQPVTARPIARLRGPTARGEIQREKFKLRRSLRIAARAWRDRSTEPPSSLLRHTMRWINQPDTSGLGLVSIVGIDVGQTATVAHRVCIGTSLVQELHHDAMSTQGARRALAFSRLTKAVQTLHAVMDSAAFNTRYRVNVQIINTTFMQQVPLMVGDDLYKEFSLEIHQDWLQRPPVKRRVGIWTSRQAGKTTAMAVIMAVVLNCGYYAHTDLISCYSKSELQAMQLLRMTETAFRAIPDNLRRRLSDCAAKHLAVLTEEGNKLRIRIHSSSIDANRGDNAPWIVCDEFCFIKEELYDNHLNAVERVDDRMVTYTTTPGQPSERLTALFLSWFNHPEKWPDRVTLNFGLVCTDCTLANCPLECRHRLHYLPPWTNAPKLMREITNATGRSRQTIMAELLGQPTEHVHAVFTTVQLIPLFQQARFDVTYIDHKRIYLMLDPATASNKSNLAMVTYCFSHGILVVLGMEDCFTWATSEREAHHLMISHVRGLYNSYGSLLQGVDIVPMLEMNNNSNHTNGFCAALVNAGIASVVDIFKASVGKSYIPYARGGVRTTAENKTAGCAEVMLRLANNTLRISSNLYSTGITDYQVEPMPTPEQQTYYRKYGQPVARPPKPNLCADGAARVMEVLREELTSLAEDARGGISGKGTSKTSTRRDDLAIAFILGPYFAMLGRNIQMQLSG